MPSLLHREQAGLASSHLSCASRQSERAMKTLVQNERGCDVPVWTCRRHTRRETW